MMSTITPMPFTVRLSARSSSLSGKKILPRTPTAPVASKPLTLRHKQAVKTTCGDKFLGKELPDAISGGEPLAHVWRSSLILGTIAAAVKVQTSLDPQFVNDVVGPAGVAVTVVYVVWLTLNGQANVKALKEELEAKGQDTTGIDRIAMLRYLKENVDSGDPDQIRLAQEIVASSMCIQCMNFGSGPDYIKWKQYYSDKGIELKTVGDLEKVRQYVRDLREEVEAKKNVAA